MLFSKLIKLSRGTQRLIDNLAYEYDFLYLLKKKENLFKVFFGFIFVFIILIFISITSFGITEFMKNIVFFILNLLIVISFSILIFLLKINHNEESKRIVDNDKNSKIDIIDKTFCNADDIKINFNITNSYKSPEIISKILDWISIKKDVFYRENAGFLDLPKLSIDSLIVKNKEENKVEINLKNCSFYDCFYTHYFADQKLSNEKSTENHQSDYTLRKLLTPYLEKHYNTQKQLVSDEVEFSNLLPNPLGLTGILKIKYQGHDYYILKTRDKFDIGARNKIQWSFAGTLDVFPNLHSETLNFSDLVNEELNDELIEYFTFLKRFNSKYYYIGTVVNQLYLFQPELFAYVEIDINEKCNEFDKLLDTKNSIQSIKNQIKSGIYSINMKSKNSESTFLIIKDFDNLINFYYKNKNETKPKFEFRNLFNTGITLLQNFKD